MSLKSESAVFKIPSPQDCEDKVHAAKDQWCRTTDFDPFASSEPLE
ncbi:hypothetical protein WJS89_03180 [Sphingomicrobium sp. XHP0235]